MTDRLRIRKANLISDDKIRVQTEIFSDSVLSATKGETIKATLSLYMRDNVLYVESITIANQPKLSDILNIYVSNESASFYAMLTYIDDQI